MAILSVVKLYSSSLFCKDSCLRIKTTEVSKEDLSQEWFKQFISDMFETLYSTSSGIGLSANQVGILKSVAVLDLKRDGKNPIILINPTYVGDERTKKNNTESCLSFPNLSVTVERFNSTQIRRVHTYIKWRIWLYYEQFRPFKALKFLHPLGEIKKQLENL